jgi:hypothetical protein
MIITTIVKTNIHLRDCKPEGAIFLFTKIKIKIEVSNNIAMKAQAKVPKM